MASGILSVAQSGLAAAQVGLTTTGHNIANANTAGYSRQVVLQTSSGGQNQGFGFVGKGTQVTEVKRMYDDFLGTQVLTSQTSKASIDMYYSQISQVNNMFADSTAGLSPSMQDFFSGVQDVAANPNDTGARQSLLSTADAMASRFQSMAGQLDAMRQGINDKITTTVDTINGYASQIAKLNDAIELAQSGDDTKPANDLLDQRDQLISQLSKEVKVTVVKQSGSGYGVFIGNGQPLVLGAQNYPLKTATSPNDNTRLEVSYDANGSSILLAESSLPGGTLGGLFDSRAKTLDPAENTLGRIAIGMATAFNAQHALGLDQKGNQGGAFFNVGVPLVNNNSGNTGGATMTASISNVGALTTSDYKLQVVTAAVAPAAGAYQVTRLSDGAVTNFTTFPQTVDGVDFNIGAGNPATGDSFLVRPTARGASGLSVKITDPGDIAAAAPIRTNATVTNKGTAKISAGTVDSTYFAAPLAAPVTLTYDKTTNMLSGFPAAQAVTVTNNGVATVFAAGAPVTYTSGATISFGGTSFTLTGVPVEADTYTVGPNTSGVGDNRNALLLAGLQTSNLFNGGTTNLQGAYGQLVSAIGNKTNELSLSSTAEGNLLANAQQAQQSLSGVNLDEEATNLIRYQQAYQAAAKVMQTASTVFETLLQLGN